MLSFRNKQMALPKWHSFDMHNLLRNPKEANSISTIPHRYQAKKTFSLQSSDYVSCESLLLAAIKRKSLFRLFLLFNGLLFTFELVIECKMSLLKKQSYQRQRVYQNSCHDSENKWKVIARSRLFHEEFTCKDIDNIPNR